jgi:hypothetical protein
MSAFDDYQIRLASDADMMTFARLKIPVPDQVVFREAGLAYVRADMSRVSDGYSSLTWVWDILTRAHINMFITLLDGEDHVLVRVRTDTKNAEFANIDASFKTFDCVMWKPILSGTEGLPIVRSELAFQTVSINFRKLVEV